MSQQPIIAPVAERRRHCPACGLPLVRSSRQFGVCPACPSRLFGWLTDCEWRSSLPALVRLDGETVTLSDRPAEVFRVIGRATASTRLAPDDVLAAVAIDIPKGRRKAHRRIAVFRLRPVVPAGGGLEWE